MRAGKRPVMALVTGIVEYQLRVIAGMRHALAERGIPLLVAADEPFASDRTPTLVLDLIRRRVPLGVIALADVADFRRSDLPDALRAAHLPLVSLGTAVGTWPTVVADNDNGMRALMGHLLDEAGVRRPVLVRGMPGNVDSEVRERVFREELAARGLPIDEGRIITGRFLFNSTYAELAALLRQRRDLDCVVALNDNSAFGALSALLDGGLRVPDDVLVTGFDNTEGSSLSWPALTTVDQDLEQQGRQAVERLLQVVAGERVDAEIRVPSRLVVRASTTAGGAAVALTSGAPEALARMPGARHVDGTLYLEGAALAGEFARIASTTRALQNRVGLQDAALNLSWTTSNCRTLDDLADGLDQALSRVGLRRCFLAVDHPATQGSTPATSGESGDWSRLVLRYPAGHHEPADQAPFPRHQLLPESLFAELEDGVLLLQALSVAGRERGHLLYEPLADSPLLTEAVRIDLPRAVDTVLSSQEMADHAAMLERVVAERTSELERANAELQRSVLRDGLTGIANRVAFEQALVECREPDGPTELALLMIDVDMFKAYNDRYGHLAGDAALRTVAACLAAAVREPEGLACRYGGEEFAVVLRGAGPERVLAVAEGIRADLAAAAIRHEASTVAGVVTVSIGTAVRRVRSGGEATALVAAADEALYRAKQAGRDRVVGAEALARVPAPR